MISLLMSVYEKESADHFGVALQSILDQITLPEEIVLVEDGPLGHDLNDVIDKYSPLLPIKRIRLKENVGLARALNVGLLHVTQPWVMRFDSDDYSLPGRVSTQKDFILQNEVDLFGSQIEEFIETPNAPIRSRTVPCQSAEIIKYSSLRNPFNHMTVCFRREMVLAHGGYPNEPYFSQDYALWMLMISSGARVLNQPETLVRARVGNGLIERRGGWGYVKQELLLQRFLVRHAKRPIILAVTVGLVRSTLFSLPKFLRAFAYAYILRV